MNFSSSEIGSSFENIEASDGMADGGCGDGAIPVLENLTTGV